MKILKEFKKFAVKGNAVDLAIGIIIGAAFNSVVKSLVEDVVMPPIGALLGNVDFSGLFINLSSVDYESIEMAKAAGAPTINYGLFINATISFLITAWVVFLVVKMMNRMREQMEGEKETESKSTKKCPFCFVEINKDATRCPNCTSNL